MSSARLHAIIDSPRTAWVLLTGAWAAVFWDLFLPGHDRVLSALGRDVSSYFAISRTFGYGELAQGNVPLWNPFLFAGAPYLANFQSTLFYPPNLIYLLLPLHTALNLEASLHILLMGVLTYFWLRQRAFHPLAAVLGGVMLMHSGAYFLHLYSGHLTLINAFAWSPLVILSVEKTLDRPRLAWCLTGIFATTMQILAGLPQAVYLTGLALGLYCAMRASAIIRNWRVAPALASIAVAPLLLSAVQLWTGIDAAEESVRAGGMPFAFVSVYSFPPENLLTAAIPGVLGNTIHTTYWGRWDIWETSIFIGIVGVLLTIIGVVSRRSPAKWIDVAMPTFLLVIAFGLYTPVYEFLYNTLPGFDRFRLPARILVLVTLYASVLAAAGLSALLSMDKLPNRLKFASLGITLALGAAAAAMWTTKHTAVWQTLHDWLASTNQVFWEAGEIDVKHAAAFTATATALAALTLAGAFIIMCMPVKPRVAAALLVLLACVEMSVFARTHRTTFSLRDATQPELKAYLDANPGDYRTLDIATKNQSYYLGRLEMWGYDPFVLKRYGDFVAYTLTGQMTGLHSTLLWPPKESHPRFDMLRCRLQYGSKENESAIIELGTPYPRFYFVNRYQLAESGEPLLRTLLNPVFNPRRTVLLEQTPAVEPQPGGEEGSVRIIAESTDAIELEIDAPNPTILVMTDAYSAGWDIRAAEPADAREYELLPANYVVRAIPLDAGQHHIILEYRPPAFRIGALVSLVSAACFAIAVLICLMRQRQSTAT